MDAILLLVVPLWVLILGTNVEASSYGVVIASQQDTDHQVIEAVDAEGVAEDLTLVEPIQSTSNSAIFVWVVCLLAVVVVILIVVFRLWRIPEGRGPPWWVRGEMLLFGWVGLVLLGLVVGVGTASVLGGATELERQAITMLVAYSAQLILIGLILYYLFARIQVSPKGRENFPERKTISSGSMGWALGIGVLGFIVAFPMAQALGMLAGAVQRRLTGMDPDAIGHQTLQALKDSPADVWGLVIMVIVVVVTPVIEEFAYRGLVQQGFRRLGANRPIAIVITSCLFVFMHVPALPGTSIFSAVVTLLVLSIVFGWLFERTGRLAAPIVAHGLFNALNLILFEINL